MFFEKRVHVFSQAAFRLKKKTVLTTTRSFFSVRGNYNLGTRTSIIEGRKSCERVSIG